MKQTISLLLVLAMLLSLSACGKKPTKEELLESDNRASVSSTSIRENPVNAKKESVGKVGSFLGYVYNITDEYAEIVNYKDYHTYYHLVRLYLPKEDIEQLQIDREVRGIGLISDVSYDKDSATSYIEATGYITDFTQIDTYTVAEEVFSPEFGFYYLVGKYGMPLITNGLMDNFYKGATITFEFATVRSNYFDCGFYCELVNLIDIESKPPAKPVA